MLSLRDRSFQRLIFTACSILIPYTCLAQPVNQTKHRDSCISLINDRTAAMVAREWTDLERLAERYLLSCRKVFGVYDDSKAEEEVAIASRMLGNSKKALAFSDACIVTMYSKAGCHLQRALALAKLNRLADATYTLEKASILIAHSIENYMQDVERAATKPERELAEAKLRNALAERSYADALRENNFHTQ